MACVRCESDVNANQEWKTYSFTYNLKDKAIEVFNPQTLLRNVKGMIELKEWQIEIGNKASDYKPAVEDQVSTDEFTKKTTEIEKCGWCKNHCNQCSKQPSWI